MARRGYPPEFRKRVIELVEAGDKRSIGTNEAACVVSSGPPTMIERAPTRVEPCTRMRLLGTVAISARSRTGATQPEAPRPELVGPSFGQPNIGIASN